MKRDGRARRQSPCPDEKIPASSLEKLSRLSPFDISNRRNTMSTTTNIAAAAAVTIFIAPASGFAQAPLKGHPQATSGAYAAATKSSRATRPAPRGGISEAVIQRVSGLDGRIVGADPDAAVRFELLRDQRYGDCRY
jgi:hypothetical protein